MVTYLVCPPTHFAVHFLGNPWLPWHDTVDPVRAREQWEGLRTGIAAAGAPTVTVPPQPGLSAMTFVRDVALVYAPPPGPAAAQRRSAWGDGAATGGALVPGAGL